MYCHYCGKSAVATCLSCEHRVCATHKAWLFGLRVCRNCQPAAAAGLVVMLLLAVGAVWLTSR